MLLALFLTVGFIYWFYDERVWIQTMQKTYWRRFAKMTFVIGIITVGAFVSFLVTGWGVLFIVAFAGACSIIMATAKSLHYYHEIHREWMSASR